MTRIFLLIIGLIGLSACGTKTHSALSKSGTGNELTEAQRLELTSLYIDAQRERMLGEEAKAESLLLRCQELDPDNHAVLYDRAQIARDRGSGPEALILAEQAIALSPDNMWYHLLAADLYVAKGDLAQAEKTYEKVIAEHPQAFDFTYDLAMIRYGQGDINGAIEALDAITARYGFSEEVFQQKQSLYRESGQGEKAVKDLEAMIEKNPKDPLFYGMLAELYSAMGQNDKAMATYEQILDFDPENGMVQLSMADHYLKLDQIDKASAALMKGFAEESIDIDIKMNHLLGIYERSETDFRLRLTCVELAEKLVEVHPNNAKSYSILGDIQLREEGYDKARANFRKAAELDPGKHVIWTQILLLDSQLEDFDGMVEDSEKALELFPADPTFYLFGGMGYQRTDKTDEAIDMYETGKEMVIDDDLTLLDFYSNLGDLYQDVGRHAESDRILDKALRIDPENPYVLNNYSYYLSLRGAKLDKAEGMARKANELSPNTPSFEDTFAWVLYQAGKYDQAETWILKAIDHGASGSGEVIEHYGDILYRLGRTAEAMDKWREAKELGGHSEQLDQKISEGQIIE